MWAQGVCVGCFEPCIWTVLLPLWDVAQGFEMRSGGGCFCEAQAVRRASWRTLVGAVGLRRDVAFLPVVLELSLQLLPGEEYAALDGAQGEAHALGYLVVLVAGDVHREGHPVLLGEGVDGGGDLPCPVRPFRALKARVLREVQVVEVLGLVYDGLGPHAAAVVVDEDVAHDGEHPSLEVGVVDVLAFVVEGLQGRVLQEVVGIVPVGREHVREVQQVALEAHELAFEFLVCHYGVAFSECVN